MKYKDENGNWIDIHVKAIDSLPIGTILDYDGTEVPEGYEAVTDPNEYSTKEQVIGTWLGKPLYRKVVNTGALLDNQVKEVEHNITNIDKIIKLYGYAYDGVTFHPLPYTHINSPSCEGLYATKEQISITTGIDRTRFVESYVTLEYTKTTD